MSTEQNNFTTEKKIEAGTLLKQKRVALGLSQKQIADRLRLRVSIIENIEENRFEPGQVATFTRGYLKSYAKAVGVKESVVLCALDDCGDALHEEQDMKSFSQKTNLQKHDSRIMKITWGILVIIIGISSVWWWQNQQQDTLSFIDEPVSILDNDPTVSDESDDSVVLTTLDGEALTNSDSASSDELETNTNTAQPVTLPELSEETVADDAITDADMASNGDQGAMIDEISTIAQVAENSDVSEPQAEAVVEAAQPIVVDSASKALNMAFVADCWIQVKDASGKTLSSGIKKGGQTIDLTGEAPFSVILGAPENVTMTLASEPVDLSGYTSGKVARFTLP